MKRMFLTATMLAFAGFATSAQGATVGDIQVCYFVQTCLGIAGFPANADGPIFIIQDTSGTNFTNVTFSINDGGTNKDTFTVGTIAAGGSFVLNTGVTSDGGVGHNFFKVTGTTLDTSDLGPNADTVQFILNGLQGTTAISTGTFTPATSKFAANDASIASMNFLGGPGENDGPCGNCYGPHIIALITTPNVSGVPEPGTISLLAGGLSLLGLARLRKRA